MRRFVPRARLGGPLLLALVIGGACSEYRSDADAKADADAGAGGPSDDASGATGTKTGPAGSGSYTGLPCDVQAVLENRCIACHSGASAGIPPLLDYADLIATSKHDATKTLAEASLERMQSMTMQMPPLPAKRSEPDEIVAFEAWTKAGMPKNAASCTEDPPDAGPMAPGPSPSAPDRDASPNSACTSGMRWTQGDTKSPLMHPGGACLACHASKGGPSLRFAGTVYRGLHDVDDCNGAGPPLTVSIAGKEGTKQIIQVTASGNFFSPIVLAAPYTVEVSDGKKTVTMKRTITGGDCNTCHTATGSSGAPGRILAPL